jgi:TonB family protein
VNCNPLRGLGGHRRLGSILSTGFLLAVFALLGCNAACAQASRKLKAGTPPEYPELAKKNNIKGTARVQLLVAFDGKVKDVKVLGGHPVLVQAVVDAVSKWKYEPSAQESIVIVKFDFGS